MTADGRGVPCPSVKGVKCLGLYDADVANLDPSAVVDLQAMCVQFKVDPVVHYFGDVAAVTTDP